MSDQALMKDGLDEKAVSRIGKALKQLDPKFPERKFFNACVKNLDTLELKQRVEHIIAQLEQALSDDFPLVAKRLRSLPKVWDPGDADDPKSGFAAWPVIDYVAKAGLNHPELALSCLEKLTPLFSAEFAIRPFIEEHPKLCFKQFNRWLVHPDDHVRRLVSEGTRPRLPWGKRLQAFVIDPSPLLPLLDRLALDDSLYVRRSVANSLNDISKDHPHTVIAWCESLKKRTRAHAEQVKANWLISHALRTLVKQGHKETFQLLGFSSSPKLRVMRLRVRQNQIQLGDFLELELDLLIEAEAQRLVLDYLIYFQKADGRLRSKVFKWKTLVNAELGKMTLRKRHSFKPISTRRYYSGPHKVAIQINGEEMASCEFRLKV